MMEVPHHIVIIDPQHEWLAASHLTGRGIACYLPLEPAYRTRGARRRSLKTQVPIFRGYLFVPTSEHYDPSGGTGCTVQYDVRLQDGTITRIAFKNRFAADAMWGVRGLMMRAGVPVVLSARVMSAVREIERRQQSPGPPFLQGDLVRVITGLMEDETLSVAACEREQVILLVEMMGRKVQMRRDIFDVELVAHATRTRRKTRASGLT